MADDLSGYFAARKRMNMKLIFTSGPSAGNKYKVDRDINIGRDVSNDIVILDPSVSLVHCRIEYDGVRACIKDLGSTNGIKLNGERIINAELSDGSRLSIGRNDITVDLPSRGKKTQIETMVNVSGPATVATDETGLAVAGQGEELSGNIFGTVTYYLKRKIADGGMGSVYEAEQYGAEGFIKKVAIKTILPSFAEKETFVASFVGEAKLVANLVHQNIVQIHQLGRHEGGYYIAMEYINGINLTDFMVSHDDQHKEIPVEIATFIVSRICRGLEYAHSKCDESGKSLGLVHRDVSPNNIMITSEGEVKLTDFGVAKAVQFMADDEGYLVGSVEYMSPEQANCSEVDGRSDLFSLGLVLYELLTGVRVFQCYNNDIHETIDRVKKAKIPDPRDYRSDIPDVLLDILMRCLQKKVTARYQTAGDLSYALESQMYSKGYGPTIVALSRYIEGLRADGVGIPAEPTVKTESVS